MGDSRFVLAHPFCELFMLDIFLRGHEKLSAQEERSEDVSLDRVMSNSRKKSKLAVRCQVESLSHPGEVSAETVVASQDTLRLSF
jgi:hypothetical protein